MALWNSDEELFALSRSELFTAVVGDVCDTLGLRRQFLPPHIRSIHHGLEVKLMIGRAMPVLEMDVEGEPTDGHPFGKMLDALDDIQRHEVYVCAGASPTYALVGELMSNAMLVAGAAGVVCDGYIRDTDRLLNLPLPVFAHGAYAQDQRGRGRVVDFRVSVQIGQAKIDPGDIVMGDIDGVLVVPSGAVEAVFSQALEKARAENVVRDAIVNGMKAGDAFRKFGIL